MTLLEDLLAEHRLLPVLTVAGSDNGCHLGRALLAGGLPLTEVTLRVDGALDALEAMAALDDLVVGAGTVVTAEQVDRVVDAGAAFVVSPGLGTAVVDRCRQHGIPVLPGVATASDLLRAVARSPAMLV